MSGGAAQPEGRGYSGGGSGPAGWGRRELVTLRGCLRVRLGQAEWRFAHQPLPEGAAEADPSAELGASLEEVCRLRLAVALLDSVAGRFGL